MDAGPASIALLEHVRLLTARNLGALTLDEALSSAGGYRSIVGVLKHVGGWVHVYRSYAFDEQPRHWHAIGWPRGLRDTIEPSKEYVDELVAWLDAGLADWIADLDGVDVSQPRPVHWGGAMPLHRIVSLAATEAMYHLGEINMLLSIARGEAWEYTEEVEENHIDTRGHGVRPDWMSDAQARAHEEARQVR